MRGLVLMALILAAPASGNNNTLNLGADHRAATEANSH